MGNKLKYNVGDTVKVLTSNSFYTRIFCSGKVGIIERCYGMGCVPPYRVKFSTAAYGYFDEDELELVDGE